MCNTSKIFAQLAVTKLKRYIIEATILTGPYEVDAVFIPRISIKSLQFPVRLAFASIIVYNLSKIFVIFKIRAF